MPNNSITQLDLFGNSDDTPQDSRKDKRPLPLIIADKWGFPLQHHIVNGVSVFLISDWFKGLMQKDNVSSDIKNAEKDTLISDIHILPYNLQDGRQRQDGKFIADKGLYAYVQNMRSVKKNPRIEQIKDYLIEAGVFMDAMRRDPSIAIESAVTTFEAEGKSQSWIEARAQGIITRKQFVEALKNAVLYADASLYAKSTESVYKGLWERTTAQLRADLEITKHENPRNSFGEYALVYTRLAEMYAITRLGDADTVDTETAMNIVYESAKLIKPQAQATAQALGIDLVTGKPLLTSGR